MKKNIIKLLSLIVITVAISGCAQEVGEKYVQASYPIVKYAWLVFLSLGIISKLVGFQQTALHLFACSVLGLIFWGLYLYIACPELCRLI
ncbi:TPA: hypothetical protein MW242_003450 [Acinetobacter baumannii]|nr:hypothetical protein [Acinetobacter baumannii]